MAVFLYKQLSAAALFTWFVALFALLCNELGSALAEHTFTKSKSTNSCSSSHTDATTVDECAATISVRGGSGNGNEVPEEGLIGSFVSKSKSSLDKFHIHGWRWHTMSLVREAGRLRNLAAKTKEDGCESLKQATDYVIGFNLRGLHAIEADLFFPWMKEKLVSVEEKELANAFATVMDNLERDRKKVAQLGESIKQSVSLACDATKPSNVRIEAIQSVAEQSAALEGFARSMMERENTLLVPSIAQIVPESEQKSFNNKVLMSLGLLESRLHLVGMYEAVQESKDNQERELFAQAIPSIPQMMIPRWKRKLYEPKTSVFE